MFEEGTNITITGFGTAVNPFVINSTAAGLAGHIIEDEGTALAQRATLNFVGNSVVATDDAGNNETDITINHLVTAVHSVAQPLTVRKNTGADVGTRPRINLIEGTNITLTVVDDAGSNEVDITIAAAAGGGSGQGLVDFGYVNRLAGDFTAANTAFVWTLLHADMQLDLTAVAGDVIEAGFSVSTTSASGHFYYDIATIVAAARVNHLSRGLSGGVVANGVQGMAAGYNPNAIATLVQHDSVFSTLAAGDISGGVVRLQLWYMSSNSRTVQANTTSAPLHFWAKNYGPQI